MAPALLKNVSTKQAEKNAIMKERRKAAEERRFHSKRDHADPNVKGGGKGLKPDKGAGKGKTGEVPQ